MLAVVQPDSRLHRTSKVSFGSFASDRYAIRVVGMSAAPPIASEFVRCSETLTNGRCNRVSNRRPHERSDTRFALVVLLRDEMKTRVRRKCTWRGIYNVMRLVYKQSSSEIATRARPGHCAGLLLDAGPSPARVPAEAATKGNRAKAGLRRMILPSSTRS